MGFLSTFDDQINRLTIFQITLTIGPFLGNSTGFRQSFFAATYF